MLMKHSVADSLWATEKDSSNSRVSPSGVESPSQIANTRDSFPFVSFVQYSVRFDHYMNVC